VRLSRHSILEVRFLIRVYFRLILSHFLTNSCKDLIAAGIPPERIVLAFLPEAQTSATAQTQSIECIASKLCASNSAYSRKQLTSDRRSLLWDRIKKTQSSHLDSAARLYTGSALHFENSKFSEFLSLSYKKSLMPDESSLHSPRL